MGVEKFLYDYLGRPKLAVAGDVVTDLFDGAAVDWINTDAASSDAPGEAGGLVRNLRLRGGCDLDAVAHYARGGGQDVLRETNFGWKGLFVRADFSHNLVLALQPDGPARRVIAGLGLDEAFTSALFAPSEDATVVVLSLWADPYQRGLRHRREGFVIGICPLGFDISAPHDLLNEDPNADLTAIFDAAKVDPEHRPFLDTLLRRLAHEFEMAGVIPDVEYKANLHTLFARASARMQLVFLLPPERSYEADGPYVYPRSVELRAWSRQVASRYADVHLVDVEDCILDDSEIQAQSHYSRLVYFRMHQRLSVLMGAIGRARAA